MSEEWERGTNASSFGVQDSSGFYKVEIRSHEVQMQDPYDEVEGFKM